MKESQSNRRRFWTVLAPLPASMLTALAQLAESRERVKRLWAFADSLCPVAPVHTLSAAKLAYYSEQIAQTFAA